MDIDAKPFEMSVKKLEFTCCEYAHICTKKQACSQKFGFVVWLEANFKSPCILPMLEVVHMLMKYVKRHDVFICEFIDVMKSTKVELHGRPTL